MTTLPATLTDRLIPGGAPYALCIREGDGYHAHEHRVTATVPDGSATVVITLHLHAWMAEHRATHGCKDVDAFRRDGLGLALVGTYDTLTEAWRVLAVAGPIPAITCEPDPTTGEDTR